MTFDCAAMLLSLTLMFTSASQSDTSRDQQGWILGTAAYFAKKGFPGDASDVELVVACQGKQTRIHADKNGDYGTKLDPCRYELLEVVASDGKKLRISPKQHRALVISPGDDTRFDVMLAR